MVEKQTSLVIPIFALFIIVIASVSIFYLPFMPFTEKESDSKEIAPIEPISMKVLNLQYSVTSAKIYKINNNHLYQTVTSKVQTVDGIYSSMRAIYYMKVVVNDSLIEGDIITIYNRVCAMHVNPYFNYYLIITSADFSQVYATFQFNESYESQWHWINITLTNIATPVNTFCIFFEHYDYSSWIKWDCDKIFGQKNVTSPNIEQWHDNENNPIQNYTVKLTYHIYAGSSIDPNETYMEICLNHTYYYSNGSIWLQAEMYYITIKTDINMLLEWYSPSFDLPLKPDPDVNVTLIVGASVQIYAKTTSDTWTYMEKEILSDAFSLFWY